MLSSFATKVLSKNAPLLFSVLANDITIDCGTSDGSKKFKLSEVLLLDTQGNITRKHVFRWTTSQKNVTTVELMCKKMSKVKNCISLNLEQHQALVSLNLVR